MRKKRSCIPRGIQLLFFRRGGGFRLKGRYRGKAVLQEVLSHDREIPVLYSDDGIGVIQAGLVNDLIVKVRKTKLLYRADRNDGAARDVLCPQQVGGDPLIQRHNVGRETGGEAERRKPGVPEAGNKQGDILQILQPDLRPAPLKVLLAAVAGHKRVGRSVKYIQPAQLDGGPDEGDVTESVPQPLDQDIGPLLIDIEFDVGKVFMKARKDCLQPHVEQIRNGAKAQGPGQTHGEVVDLLVDGV